MTCPSCSAENLVGARFCVSCGATLPAATGRTGADPTAVVPTADEAAATSGADTTQVVAATDPSDGAIDRLRCPHCGSANSARRELCGRCGTDLRTGTPPAARDVVVPGPVPDSPESRTADLPVLDHTETPRVGRVVAVVIGVGVLLGALIGGLVALRTGPGNGDEDEIPAAPTFDAARYPDEPLDLPVAAIGASSTAPDAGDTSFAASNMVDGDLTTAWNNDAAENPTGVGETIALEFDGPVWVTALVLANGSQSDDGRYLGEARVRRVRVSFDAGDAVEVTFLDQQGLQEVTLDPPRLTTGLRITVLEVYPGDTHDELAVSELRVEGHDAVGADVDVARRRADGDQGTESG